MDDVSRYLVPATEPFIGPCKYERTNAACLEGGRYLQIEGFRLRCLTVPTAVQTDLGHQQGTFTCTPGHLLHKQPPGLRPGTRAGRISRRHD